MKEEIKEYKLITDIEAGNMYMIIDGLNIFYKTPIKNSITAINTVLHFFEEFSAINNIPCGNLYVAELIDEGEVYYYGVCDGLSNDYTELEEKYGTDYSIEFLEYCDSIELDLD